MIFLVLANVVSTKLYLLRWYFCCSLKYLFLLLQFRM